MGTFGTVFTIIFLAVVTFFLGSITHISLADVLHIAATHIAPLNDLLNGLNN
jgi:hypothetical protein